MTDRGDYVWVREVAAANCPNPRAYFYRAGAMLRVMQALGATDLHHENFVPAADQPVLVDLETVIGPGRGWAGTAGTTERPERLDLPGPTSMVSSWTDGPPGRRSLNLGALAGPEESLTPDAVPTLVQAPGGGPPTLRHRRLTTTNGAALPRWTVSRPGSATTGRMSSPASPMPRRGWWHWPTPWRPDCVLPLPRGRHQVRGPSHQGLHEVAAGEPGGAGPARRRGAGVGPGAAVARSWHQPGGRDRVRGHGDA